VLKLLYIRRVLAYLGESMYVILLKEISSLGVRPINVRMDSNHKLLKDDEELFGEPSRYLS
jgi:hypothetical protein